MGRNVWNDWQLKELAKMNRKLEAEKAAAQAAYDALSTEQTPVTDADRALIEKLRGVTFQPGNIWEKKFIQSLLKAATLSEKQRYWLPVLVHKYRKQTGGLE